MTLANEDVALAEQALKDALFARETAERDLDVARHMLSAAKEDMESSRPVRSVTIEKRRWLEVLCQAEVFGSVEMQEAAKAVGWNANPGTLRTLASDYRKAGYFVRAKQGFMYPNRDLLQKVLGIIFDGPALNVNGDAGLPPGDEHVAEHDPLAELDVSISKTDRSAHAPERLRAFEDEDGYDDDLPF